MSCTTCNNRGFVMQMPRIALIEEASRAFNEARSRYLPEQLNRIGLGVSTMPIPKPGRVRCPKGCTNSKSFKPEETQS